MVEKKETKAAQAKKVEAKSKGAKKASVLSIKGQAKGEVSLPEAFETEYRPDLIQRAVVAEQSWERQPYGTDPKAGFRTTAEYYSRRREYYRMTMNKGISRLPRQKLAKGGLGEVRRVPNSKGGHRAHPPKVEKILSKKMNGKEWVLALKSAIAATLNEDLVKGEGRNHAVKEITLPLIIENEFEKLSKTSDVYDAFEKIGLVEDVDRASQKKTKAGLARTGKMKVRKSVLLVVSDDCDASKAARNIPGVDVASAKDLSVELLAPGGFAGRLTLWTQAAVEKIPEAVTKK